MKKPLQPRLHIDSKGNTRKHGNITDHHPPLCFYCQKRHGVSYLGSLLVTIRQKRTKMIQTFVCNLETTTAWVNYTRNINKGFSVCTVPYRTLVLNWQRFLMFFYSSSGIETTANTWLQNHTFLLSLSILRYYLTNDVKCISAEML